MLHQSQKQLRSALRAFALAASLPLVLTGCQDEEFGYNAEDIKYAKAYEEFFGELPKDKSWDLSSYTNHYHYQSSDETRAVGSPTPNGVTPTNNQLREGDKSGGNEYQVLNEYWKVPQKTFDWMKAALKEGKDNRYLGAPFVLQLPNNDFAIVPIFQGKSSITSELEVKVNGYQITTVWKRNQGIQIKDTHHTFNGVDASDWTNLGYYAGYSGITQDIMRVNPTMYPTYTDEADEVQAKPIYFRSKDFIGNSNNKGFMYLSLHNVDKAWATWDNCNSKWDKENSWTTVGHRLTSINPSGHMLALNVPTQYRPAPSELPDICEYDDLKDPSKGRQQPSQVIFVSCEDANGSGTDHDVNDVAFLIIGYPNAPTIVPTTEVIEKRYMCEDLGGTYDYDFNDIVVDCKQTQKYIVSAEPNELENYDPEVAGNIIIKDMIPDGCPVQTAKVSRLCGTIPLQIRIGDFMFPKIKDPMAHENQWDGYDGRGGTRSDLCSDEYYLYSHKHCATCCANHGSIGAGPSDRIKYGHKNITRAELPDNNNITLGWNPNEEQVIPCHTWDPDKNNIIIYADWGYYKKLYNAATVNANGELDLKDSNPFPENTEDFADFANGKKFPVSFPNTGEYPYIIATDVDVPWMKEDQHIPAAWIDGDMSARSDASGSNHDLIGNSYYMENYPVSDAEGYIWSGDVTGLAYSTGVTFANPSAELAGIKEAFDHQYFIMHVYVDVPAGEVGRIGLYSANDWKPILDSDPDGYMAVPLNNRQHQTYLGVDGLQCATIYLTRAQRDDILANGLVVASRTDGVRIKKVTTARPCMYWDNNGTKTVMRGDDAIGHSNGGTVWVDAGFIINIDQSKLTNGRVMSDESERVASMFKEEDGKTLTSAEQAHNDAEPGRVNTPFTTRQFISGTTVTLTAIGNTVDDNYSYKVTGWLTEGDFTPANTSNPLVINYSNTTAWGWNNDNIKKITVYPIFAQAKNPKLKYADGVMEKTVTLAIEGGVTKPYNLYATSGNLTTVLDQFGANNDIVGTSFSISGGQHVISLDPKTVGETSFVIYQKDGTHSGEDYGVSAELKLTVKVVQTLPNVSSQSSLGNWAMFQWHGTDANAYIVDKVDGVVNYNTDVKTDGSHQIFSGTQYGNCYRYVDLPHAKWLVAEVNSGNIEFKFNTKVGNNGDEIQGESVTISANSKDYCQVIDNGPTAGKKYYLVNVEALRNKYGYVHLNSVRALWQQTANVAWIKADNDYSEVRGIWNDLKGEISSATVNLTKDDIYKWSDASGNATSDATHPTGNGREIFWHDSSSPTSARGEKLIGDSWTNYASYINLSRATVIVATVPKNGGEIAFAFNQQPGTGDNAGYNGDYVNVRPFGEYRDYCAVVTDGDNFKYVIDADGLKNKLGVNYLHLNYIWLTWDYQSSYVSHIVSLKTDAYTAPNPDSPKIAALKASVDGEPSPTKTYPDNANWITPQTNTECSVVYGTNINVQTSKLYDDMTTPQAKYIVVQVEGGYGAPRFFFNYVDGSSTDGFVVTTAENTKYLLSESSEAGTTSYYIDLDALRNDKDKAYLNSIRSSGSGQNIKVRKIGVGVKY